MPSLSRHGVKIALGSLGFPVIKISMVCQVHTCMLLHLHMYCSKYEDKTCLTRCMNMMIVNACGFVSVFVCIMTKTPNLYPMADDAIHRVVQDKISGVSLIFLHPIQFVEPKF